MIWIKENLMILTTGFLWILATAIVIIEVIKDKHKKK